MSLLGPTPFEVLPLFVFDLLVTDSMCYFCYYRHTRIYFELNNEQDTIALSARGLGILSVCVDETVAEFEPLQSKAQPRDLYDIESHYRHIAISRVEPDLIVRVPGEINRAGQQDQKSCLRIEYSLLDGTDHGIVFKEGFAVTRGDVGSISRWMPCLNAAEVLQDFELEILVPAHNIAVCSGRLEGIVKSKTLVGWTLYRYKTPFSCAPRDLALVVGPLKLHSTVVLGDKKDAHRHCTLTHFAPRNSQINSQDLQRTCSFFTLPMELYSDVLAGMYPTDYLHHVVLPEEVIPSDFVCGVGLQISSSKYLLKAKNVEKSHKARRKLAGALAHQWFGFFLRPLSMNDTWMVRGLCVWLADQFVLSYLGKTDYLYRKWLRHISVAEMDNGEAPPLAFHSLRLEGLPWGPCYGTEYLDPSKFHLKKSAAVVSMIEARSGDQLFKKQIESTFRQGIAEGQRKLDAKLLLVELSKAGDFRAEVNAFIERWVFGSGAPSISLGIEFHRRGCTLDVGLKQCGSLASLNSTLSAEMEARKEKMGTSGIVKVAVREGSGVTVEHPLHLGVKGFLLTSLSVNPEVKKIPGKRGRKKKEEEEMMAAKQAALLNAQHPVQYVRIDPSSEVLCCKHVHQPTRMMANKLKNSRDVVAQAEAARELGAATVTNFDMKAVQVLSEALEDPNTHWTTRSEAAMALGQILGEDGGSAGMNRCIYSCVILYPLIILFLVDAKFPITFKWHAGVQPLIEFYKKRFWSKEDDIPQAIKFQTIDEYLVTRAVLLSLSKCKNPEGYTHFDAIIFFKHSLDGYWCIEDRVDTKLVLAALCTAWGNLRCSKARYMHFSAQIKKISVKRKLI